MKIMVLGRMKIIVLDTGVWTTDTYRVDAVQTQEEDSYL